MVDINKEINKRIRQKADEKLPLSQWIIKKKIVNEMGYPLEFDAHKFLEQPMNDWTRQQVCMKASQIGVSTVEILKSFHAAKVLGWNVIYTLPSANKLWDFQSSKTDELIAQNDVIKSWIGKDSAMQKKVGNRYVTYRGSYKEADAISLTADVLMQDEYDRSKMEILDLYESRLGMSKYKGVWRFSNPSAPRIGVHKYWLQSDQKFWFIRCSHCNTQQFLGWFDAIDPKEYAATIDLEKEVFLCRKCGKLIPEHTRNQGEWVARFKDKEMSGYWISQLMAPWISYKQIFHSFKNKEMNFFYNFLLGLPTKGERFQITKDLVFDKCITIDDKREIVFMGVDVGKTLHYVLATEHGIFEVGTTKDWDVIEGLIEKYKAVTVIDSEPDITMPQKMQKKYKNLVYLADYHRTRKAKEWVKWGEKKEFGRVSAHRSRAIGVLVDYLRNKLYFTALKDTLYNMEDYEKSDDYVSHLESFYQVAKMDALTGETYYEWDSGIKDHYGQATIYCILAMLRGGGKVEVSSESMPEQGNYYDGQDHYFEQAKEGSQDNKWLEN